MIELDKKLLKKLRVLYVEDDTSIRNELSELLSKFFETVHTASNGKEGLKLYKNQKDHIDVIIADINMPELNGIDMVKAIRTFDKKVPVIFATAYSDNDFLSEAISLKVYDYIIKPIDIRVMMSTLTELATVLYNDTLINNQNKELIRYKDIIYNNNVVIRTNKNMEIEYTNDLFCQITGFDKKELLGKNLISLKHKDSDEAIYKKMFNAVLNNKQWKGQLKNITKDNSFYIADTQIITTLDDSGEITGSLVIQKDETREVQKKRDVQTALIKDKGDIFIKGKESSAELSQTINILNNKIVDLGKEVDIAKSESNKYIYTAEKYTVENKRLKLELMQFKKNADYVENRHSMSMKLSKENSDLHQEIKRLSTRLDKIESDHEKECKQIRVNYEVRIDDLDEELDALKEKLDSVGSSEAIAQKLAYWKEKAKTEAKKIEELERKVINHGDQTMMDKLFGRR